MRKQLTIAAGDVKVGDELYNDHAYHSTAAWVPVIAVQVLGTDVRISTSVWHTTKHVREGIAVMREVPE